MNLINCKGKLVELESPTVMGILNITPDSFYDGGKYGDVSYMESRVDKMIDDGAKIIDIGGMSSRPGAEIISPAEELARVNKAILYITENYHDPLISIDTLHAEVALEAVGMGAHLVNDISGGTYDEKMYATVAELGVPYIIMHMQGNPKNMQKSPKYDDVVLDVLSFFARTLREVKRHGIKDVIIDPGFGFGKSVEHNYKLLSHLSSFKILGRPVLVGISRKSMLYKPLSIKPDEALNASTAAHMIALQNGAKILRVHDVKEAIECISVFELSKTYN